MGSQLNLLHGTKKAKGRKLNTTRMWANAQHDGRPAEHSGASVQRAKFG